MTPRLIALLAPLLLAAGGPGAVQQAEIALRARNGEGAMTALDQALRQGTPAAAIAHLRAQALLLQGEPEKALATAAKAGGSAATRGEAARIAGQAALLLGRSEDAAGHYDRALSLTPRSATLWTDIARFRLTTGDAGGAITAVNRALALDPDSVGATLLSAQLTRGQYGPRAALPVFQRALDLDPGNVTAMIEMAATLAEAGQARAALALTRDVLTIDRANPRAYFIQTVIAARAGRYALARALLYRTGGRIDGVPAVQLLRGTLEIEAGNSEQAVARLEDLLRIRPLHFPARRLLGLARFRARDFKGTVGALTPMARRRDADAWTLALTGRALEAQGERAAAAPFLDRASASRPGPAESFALASWPGADAGDADIAIPRISQLVANGAAREAVLLATSLRSRNPGSPGAAVALGDALMAAGERGPGADAYAQAANIDFSEPVALRLIAALKAAGRDADAAKAASLYLEQNPRSIAALTLAADAAAATGNWQRAALLFRTLRARIGIGNLGARIGLALALQRLGVSRSGA